MIMIKFQSGVQVRNSFVQHKYANRNEITIYLM